MEMSLAEALDLMAQMLTSVSTNAPAVRYAQQKTRETTDGAKP